MPVRRRTRTAVDGKAPFCQECKSADAHVVSRVAGDPQKGHLWLCGSCELARERADLAKGSMPTLPSTRKVPLQKETLF